MGTYSEIVFEFNQVNNNLGGIIVASQHVVFLINENIFANNTLEKYAIVFKVSLFASGSIRNCVFLFLKGRDSGFLLKNFNSFKSVIFHVT